MLPMNKVILYNLCKLNFYQIISLAALYYFNKSDLDLWILEIGMGGRLDPMNFIEPDISVITKVALDHQEFVCLIQFS